MNAITASVIDNAVADVVDETALVIDSAAGWPALFSSLLGAVVGALTVVAVGT